MFSEVFFFFKIVFGFHGAKLSKKLSNFSNFKNENAHRVASGSLFFAGSADFGVDGAGKVT